MHIITNVGNRNLLYNKEPITKFLEGKSTTYREFTSALVKGEQYASVEISILDAILNKYSNSVDRIILISTDQKMGGYRDQDTVYASKLIAGKIARTEAWKHMEVVEYTLPISIERTSEVMNWYKRFLNGLIDSETDKFHLICDAGGAPQMKNALKIMAEFVLPKDKYSVEYVKQYNGEIIEVEQDEYRKVIAAYQVESLLPGMDYHAAINIWRGVENRKESKDDVFLYLDFLAKRSGLLLDMAKPAAERLKGRLKKPNAILENYASRNIGGLSADPGIETDLLFMATELVELCDYHREIGNLNQMVMFAQRFIEYFLGALIESHLNFRLISGYGQGEVDKMIKYAAAEKIKVPGIILDRDSVPTRLAVVGSLKLDFLAAILDSFVRLGEGKESLGVLRNSLAHKGLSVTEARLNAFCPTLRRDIVQWRSFFAEGKNTYHILNRELTNIIRKQ